MEKFDATELWRLIPPEEKIDLLSRSHGSGILSALTVIVIGATLAVGLQIQMLLWGSLLLSPILFQIAAGKKWKTLRPKMMLEYLAVRTVSRRFAFMLNSRELNPKLIFRGRCQEVFEEDDVQATLAAAFDHVAERDVWIALFTDAIVVMVEDVGGARMHFGCSLLDSVTITGRTPEGGSDYSSSRVVRVEHKERGHIRRVDLTSPHAAALVVFEKQALAYRETLRVAAPPELVESFVQELLGGQIAD